MSASAPTLTTSPRAQLRRALDDAVAGLQAGRAVLLLALDLDDFRRYNAEHGYEAGDALLERFAARLAGVEGASFALGADAFALVLEGTPEELWRRGAGALWALDPGSGGVELRCSFGAAVIEDGGAAETADALAVAEDRLADQRNRAPSVAERYGELILAILAAQQPLTSEHAFDVAALAAGVAARLGVDPLDRGLVRRAAELHDVGKIAIDPAIVHNPGPLDDAEWRRCASTRPSATSCCSPPRRCAPSRRSCARATSAGTAAATPTASPAMTSRSRHGSSRHATPTTR